MFHYSSRGLFRFGCVILILEYQQMEITKNWDGLRVKSKKERLIIRIIRNRVLG